MTAFGKILAFLNLVFALLTGALIGMVYLTRTNWEQSYRQVQAKAVAADASYKQLLSAEMAQVVAKDTLLQKAITDRDANSKTIAQKETDIDQLKKQLDATQHTVGDDAQNSKTLTESGVLDKATMLALDAAFTLRIEAAVTWSSIN